MRRFGLIGHPLGHSFSQKYFSEKFRSEHIENCVYENFPLETISALPQLLNTKPDLEGLNVTIPYKTQVLPFLDDAEDTVLQIQSCNCIHIVSNRKLGFNTDVVGFENSFIKLLQPHHKKALVLGSGGSAKAVCFVLKKLGIGFSIVSRGMSPDGYQWNQLSEETIRKYLIIINCTPIGMFPNISQAPPLPYSALSEKHYAYDLVYNPEMTQFLRLAQQQGACIKNGYDMLVIQAEESWKIWNRR